MIGPDLSNKIIIIFLPSFFPFWHNSNHNELKLGIKCNLKIVFMWLHVELTLKKEILTLMVLSRRALPLS